MGGIVKYPPTGTTPPKLPTVLPPSLLPPPPPPPKPTGNNVQPSGVVLPNPVVVNNLNAQISYSNQKIGYFKIDLYNTKPNLYGESVENGIILQLK